MLEVITHKGSYADIKRGKILSGMNSPDQAQFSIDRLEKMRYDDVKNLDRNFDPRDLIDENDDEDNLYLAEYSLNLDKQLKQHNNLRNKKQFEEPGK